MHQRKKESEVAQSCPTLCNPMDWSLPGSSIHGIFQTRILEWVAISFSRKTHAKWTLMWEGFLDARGYRSNTIVQFSSVQSLSRVRLCDSMNRSTPGLPVHHQLLEFTQTHVHQVGDAIQPSHPLSSPSPPAPNPSQHQGLFQ